MQDKIVEKRMKMSTAASALRSAAKKAAERLTKALYDIYNT
jgi:hypothetical protein